MSKRSETIDAASSSPASASPTGIPTVLLIHGDKGGVGKTMLATALIDYLIGTGKPLSLVDADTRNADVVRMFDGAIPTVALDLQRDEGWMDLIDFVMAQAGRHVVVSLPGGIGERVTSELPRLWDQLGTDRRLGLAWVLNRGPDSVNLLGHALAALRSHLAFVAVVKNLYFGTSEQFTRWDESALRAELERMPSAVTISLGELVDRVVDKVFGDPEAVLPYSAVKVEPREWEKSPKGLTASENVRLLQWIDGNRAAFDRLVKVAQL